MKIGLTSKIILVGFTASLFASSADAQVSAKGLTPAPNTYRSYQDASIARDSNLNQPLDLLNDFYPSIEVTISDHDNVRARPDLDEEDLKIIAKPSLAYRTNVGRHQFYAAYNGVYTFHNDLDQEDATSHALVAKAGIDFSRSWDLDVFGGIGNSFEQRGVSGTRPYDFGFYGVEDGPSKIDFLSYGADLVYGRKASDLTAVLGFEHTETGYKTSDGGSFIDAGNRDRESDSVHFDLNYRIGGKTSIFGRYQRTEFDYDRQTNSLDSTQEDYLLGLRWKPSNALSGVIGVGWTDKEFDHAASEGYEGNNYYVNLSYMLNPFSSISIGASRLVEEPSDVNSTYYESELIGIGWDHSLTPQLVFNTFAKWVDDDYDTNRQDKFFDWGVGLDYIWKDWMTAGIFYGEIERESSSNNVSYDDAYFGIRIRSDLRSLLKNRGKQEIEPASFGPLEKTEASKR
jgi:hypothetical protein